MFKNIRTKLLQNKLQKFSCKHSEEFHHRDKKFFFRSQKSISSDSMYSGSSNSNNDLFMNDVIGSHLGDVKVFNSSTIPTYIQVTNS